MRKWFFAAIVIALLAWTWAAYAAPPPEGPPGLAKAIAAQEKHNPQLLTTPGVVATAVGLGKNGMAVVTVYTAKRGVGHLPVSLDGVPVVVRVTGKLVALGKAPPKPNTAPVVTISSPADGTHYGSGAPIVFAATAVDKEDGDLSGKLIWTSSRDGRLGTGTDFYRVLSDGPHTITASATDKRRTTGKNTVTITVGGTPDQPKTTDIWLRPVPIGVSTGNFEDVSAGTIACRVVDEDGNVYALSNTHVYAPNDIDGQSEIGDVVTQPGLYDAPYDQNSMWLGSVFAYKPINGSIFATNDIDAAIALTDVNTLGTSTPTSLGGYGVPNKTTTAAALNMAVQKFGRTTLLTKGKITGINATTAVGYGDNWYAFFSGQIIVETSSAFVLPGDSGSLVVTDDVNANANPVGLLFAGNAEGTMAIVNPIGSVLQYFGVAIDGK